MMKLYCRCGEEAKHLDLVKRSDAGVQTLESLCQKCGLRTKWRYVDTPEERAIKSDELPPTQAWLRRKKSEASNH